MAKKQLSEYSNDELNAQLKKMKPLFLILIGLVIAMTIISILTYMEAGFGMNVFLPLFFIPLIFVYRYQISSIKKELRSRNQ